MDTVETTAKGQSDMNAHRLTFDPTPKELASRDAGVTRVLLLWSRRTGRAAVVVEDDATGEVIEMEINKSENPLELFDHPFAYAPQRSHPGWKAPVLAAT